MAVEISESTISSPDATVRIADITAVSKRRSLYGWCMFVIGWIALIFLVRDLATQGVAAGRWLFIALPLLLLLEAGPTWRVVVQQAGGTVSFSANVLTATRLLKRIREAIERRPG